MSRRNVKGPVPSEVVTTIAPFAVQRLSMPVAVMENWGLRSWLKRTVVTMSFRMMVFIVAQRLFRNLIVNYISLQFGLCFSYFSKVVSRSPFNFKMPKGENVTAFKAKIIL